MTTIFVFETAIVNSWQPTILFFPIKKTSNKQPNKKPLQNTKRWDWTEFADLILLAA